MTAQLSLPFQAHSDTSRMAALRALAMADSWRGRVCRLIDGCASFGLTDEEGIDRLAMNPSTYRPRRIELVHGIEGIVPAGMVVDSGRRRPTCSGSMAVVWVSFRYADNAPTGATTHPVASEPSAGAPSARSNLPTAGTGGD